MLFIGLIILMLIPVRSYALLRLPDSDLVWKNIRVDGKKKIVFCIFKDSRGLVWLGTDSGLYFYDGVTARPVRGGAMQGVQIHSIVEKEQSLFIGSNNGLLVYHLDTGVMDSYSEFSPKEIRSMLLVGNTLWMGSLYGIHTFDFSSRTSRDVSEGLPHKSVYSLLRDSRGILYAGTYNGLARWNLTEGKFKAVPLVVNGVEEMNVFVNCLLESDDGQFIYLGSEGALYRYEPMYDSWMCIPQLEGNNIKSLAKSKTHHLLVGTDNGIFDLYQQSVRHFRHDSRYGHTLSDNEIWCLYSDNKNNVWAGHEKGFSIASNSTFMRVVKLSALTHSGEGNEIHSICRDSSNRLWLGGTNGVICLSDSQSPLWYRHSDNRFSLSHSRVRAIREDEDGYVWLATDGGVNRFNPETSRFDVYHVVDRQGKYNSNWVYAIEEDGSKLWVGSYLGGLHCVSKEKFMSGGGKVIADCSINAEQPVYKGVNVGLANDLINDVVRDSLGNIWILLFRNSLLTCLTVQNECKQYDIFAMTGNYPTHLSLDAEGRLWCAYKGGVVLFEKEEVPKTIAFPVTEEEDVLAMGKVGADMWVSTQSNVWKVDGKTLEVSLLPIPQKSYTALWDDGATGKVYLGGTDELLEVSPDSLKQVSENKTIHLVLKDAGNGRFDLSNLADTEKHLTLPYGGKLTLMVATLDYSPESVQRYEYKLAKSPYDMVGKWIVMPEGYNSITLSDVSMGDYYLLVKSVGVQTIPLVLPLTVEGPWMLSWWAFLIYGCLLLCVVVAVIEYYRRRNLKSMQEADRKKALKEVERKLTFLSNISHDLKTPLSMIMGPVSLLKERTVDEETKKSLEVVYDNAVRLNNLIHRTLELNHLEVNEEGLLILSMVDVVAFCRGIFANFKVNNVQKNFVFHSSYSRLFIEADAVKFESVITNLLSNACKYSENGATISCGINVDENFVEIVVSDDGLGIAEADQPLVFQRMYRAASTAKLKDGTGIGLYLIKKYLELMHGTIDLYSREGQGTSFIVRLPLSEQAELNSGHGVEEVTDLNKSKVLIVEDNLQIALFIKDLLKKDYTSLIAENGRAGISIASSFLPDVIVVDEMMPVMRGTEMVRLIKQNPRLSLIPIIMLTAQSDHLTENESVKLGVDAFMGKPFEPAILLGRISHFIQTKQELEKSARIQQITEVKPIEAKSVIEKQLAKISKTIEENISDPDLNVNLLCDKCGIPNKQLYRLIKKYMGIGPLDYIRQVRLQKAAMLLRQHRFTVAEVSYMVGFKTPSYFAKCFQAQYGVKPSEYMSEENI